MYYFEAHSKRDLIACWECEADTLEEAVNKFAEHLKRTDIYDDDFDRLLYIEISKRLAEQNYEYEPDESTIYLIFTEEELEAL